MVGSGRTRGDQRLQPIPNHMTELSALLDCSRAYDLPQVSVPIALAHPCSVKEKRRSSQWQLQQSADIQAALSYGRVTTVRSLRAGESWG